MYSKNVFPLIEKNEMGDVFWVCYNIELNQKCLKELKNASRCCLGGEKNRKNLGTSQDLIKQRLRLDQTLKNKNMY
jgi:hypothetical protein